MPLFERVDQWVARQRPGRWRKVVVRDGAKGPIAVRVLLASVQTKDEDGCVGPRERLVVLRRDGDSETTYHLSNAHKAKRWQVAWAQGSRHRVEEVLAEGKGEVGLAHYEVRSWVGWRHHMTLSLLALWFLQTERLRLGGKNPGGDSVTGTVDLHGTAARAGGQPGADRREGQPSAAA